MVFLVIIGVRFVSGFFSYPSVTSPRLGELDDTLNEVRNAQEVFSVPDEENENGR